MRVSGSPRTTETMAEITAKFREKVLLVPQYATDEEMKKVRYNDVLWDDFRGMGCYKCSRIDHDIRDCPHRGEGRYVFCNIPRFY